MLDGCPRIGSPEELHLGIPDGLPIGPEGYRRKVAVGVDRHEFQRALAADAQSLTGPGSDPFQQGFGGYGGIKNRHLGPSTGRIEPVGWVVDEFDDCGFLRFFEVVFESTNDEFDLGFTGSQSDVAVEERKVFTIACTASDRVADADRFSRVPHPLENKASRHDPDEGIWLRGGRLNSENADGRSIGRGRLDRVADHHPCGRIASGQVVGRLWAVLEVGRLRNHRQIQEFVALDLVIRDRCEREFANGRPGRNDHRLHPRGKVGIAHGFRFQTARNDRKIRVPVGRSADLEIHPKRFRQVTRAAEFQGHQIFGVGFHGHRIEDVQVYRRRLGRNDRRIDRRGQGAGPDDHAYR